MIEATNINVSGNLCYYSIHDLYDGLVNENLKPVATLYNFYFDQLSFIDPSGVTSLCNLIEWLQQNGSEIVVHYPEKRTDSLKYLDDSGFFARYAGKPLFDDAKMRVTTFPIETVSVEQSFSWINHRFANWLVDRMGHHISAFQTLKNCLGEIFINIQDHSMQRSGCTFAQHYPNKDELHIAVSDFGQGIPNVVRGKFEYSDDAAALKASLEKGFSTQSTPRNRGWGLDTIVTTLAELHNGKVYIHSGKGYVRVKKSTNNKLAVASKLYNETYTGTLIYLIFDTNTFAQLVDDEEDLQW